MKLGGLIFFFLKKKQVNFWTFRAPELHLWPCRTLQNRDSYSPTLQYWIVAFCFRYILPLKFINFYKTFAMNLSIRYLRISKSFVVFYILIKIGIPFCFIWELLLLSVLLKWASLFGTFFDNDHCNFPDVWQQFDRSPAANGAQPIFLSSQT